METLDRRDLFAVNVWLPQRLLPLEGASQPAQPHPLFQPASTDLRPTTGLTSASVSLAGSFSLTQTGVYSLYSLSLSEAGPSGSNDCFVFSEAGTLAFNLSEQGSLSTSGFSTSSVVLTQTVSLVQGQVVGDLPLPGPRARTDYQGLGFSPDGTELWGVINLPARVGPRVRLRSWAMTDGRSKLDVGVDDQLGGTPLPGPEPGTVILPLRGQFARLHKPIDWQQLCFSPGQIVESTSGATILDMNFMAARWAGTGRLLGFGGLKPAPHVPLPEEANQRLPNKNRTPPAVYQQAVEKVRADSAWRALYVVSFGPQTLTDRARANLAAVAPRPPVRTADRSAVKTLRPAAPAAWAVPVGAARPAPPPAADALWPDWPAAFADTQVALIAFVRQGLPVPRLEVHWQRHDRRTGRAVGRPIVLWPWWASRPAEWEGGQPAAVAALSADGKKLALRDPADLSRVDVWDETGTRLLGLVPAGPKPVIDWLGWSGGGRLLTLAGGTLTAWDIPAGKAIYEITGGYQTPLQLAPGRAWLAAATADHVDLLDPATGRCLGRCRSEGVRGGWDRFIVSPDGRTLLRLRSGNPAQGKHFAAHVWNLTTGRQMEVIQLDVAPHQIHWCGPRQLVGSAGLLELIDLDARSTVCQYGLPKGYAPPRVGDRDREMVRSDPGGRLWLNIPNPRPNLFEVPRVWRPVAVPNPRGRVDGILARLEEGAYPFRPGATVQVKVDLDDHDRSLKAARTLAALLQEAGHVIGPKGWTLRLSHQAIDTPQRLQRYEGDREGIVVPGIRLTWQLLAPDGKEAWQTTEPRVFSVTGSKYVVSRKVQHAGGMNVLTKTRLEFEGQNPRTAMLEEVLDGQADRCSLPPGLPRALLRAQGQYRTLPLRSDLQLEPAP